MYLCRCKMSGDIEVPCQYTFYSGSLQVAMPLSRKTDGPWLVIRLADDSVLKCRLRVIIDSFETWENWYVRDETLHFCFHASGNWCFSASVFTQLLVLFCSCASLPLCLCIGYRVRKRNQIQSDLVGYRWYGTFLLSPGTGCGSKIIFSGPGPTYFTFLCGSGSISG
jgi:hypothetical protein